MAEFSREHTETLHQWAVWSLERAEFLAPDGEKFERTYVLSPGAVAVVPITFRDDGPWVTLVKQFRPAFSKEMLEIPAGMRDVVGEPPAVTAARELLEETGLTAGRLEPLGHLASAPGITNSEVSIFVGTELQAGAHHRHGPEETYMDVVEMPLVEAVAQVRAGTIDDSKTMIGLLLVSDLVRGEQRG